MKLEGYEKTVAESAFCAGMLTNIGILMLVVNFPKQLEKVHSLVDKNGLSILQAENELLGATHAELGAYLLGLWGFGIHIVDPVAEHHCPGEGTAFGVTSAVNIAQYLTMNDGDVIADKMICGTLDTAHLEGCEKLTRMDVWKSAYESLFHEG